MSSTPDPPQKPKLRVRKSSAPVKPAKTSSKRLRRGSSRLDQAAKILLGTAVVAAPWYFGSVSAVAQLCISVAFLACLVLWLIANGLSKRDQSSIHFSSLFVLLLVGVGFVQQLQLPQGLASRVASEQLKIRNMVADELNGPHAEVAEALRSTTRIALNGPAARYQHTYFVLCAIALMLGTRFFYRRTDVLWLATGLALNGVVLAIFGAFQKVANSNAIYGSLLEFGGVPFASFVNRNNAAGYLLICLGCGVAVLIYSFSNLKVSSEAEKKIGPGNEGRLQNFIRELGILLANLNVWRITLLVSCAILVSGVAMSLSRGGMISLLISMILLLLFLFRNQKNRALILVTLFLLPIGAASFGWAAFQDGVVERLETLNEEDIMTTENRVQLWKDSIQAVKDYPILGSGAGSFPYVYKEYQTTKDASWYFHAENTFLELLITLGIVGASLLVCLSVVWIIAATSLPKPKSDSRKAEPKTAVIGILGFFVLVSQGVCNFFDFGLLIPSNGIAFSLLMGALIGVYSTYQATENPNQPRLSLFPRWTKWPLVVILIAASGYTVFSFYRESKTESAVKFSRTKSVEELSLAQVNQRIDALETIEKTGNANLETYEFLGVLYTLRFQHKYVNYQLENSTQETPTREQVAKFSTIRFLNFVLKDYDLPDPLPGRNLDLTELRGLPFFQDIEAAVKSYEEAIKISPLSIHSIVGLAELARLVETDPTNYFSLFSKLNVRKASWFRRMGEAAIAHKRTELAIKHWRRALEIEKLEYETIVPNSLVFLGIETTCEKVLPAKPRLLLEIAKTFFSGNQPASQEARDLVMQRIIETLSDKAFTDAESNYLLGYAFKEMGDFDSAIPNYVRAISINPLRTQWKHELSLMYEAVGEIEEAIKLNDACIADEPENEAYQSRRGTLRKSLPTKSNLE